ncbi:DODA-type extradiol aromatic ring-opening family dioxygenase [Aspergillus lucknowensis]|uniref:Extradiol ring-cleavage dioxygenase, class III enzyme, subunit B n=1 Tax=Aspergillus lucknowensis TaxID=176173 RepID=A0ABR4M4E6_9EURO
MTDFNHAELEFQKYYIYLILEPPPAQNPRSSRRSASRTRSMSFKPNRQRNPRRPSKTAISLLTLAAAILLAFLSRFTKSDSETNSTTNLFGLRRLVPGFWTSSGSLRQLGLVAGFDRTRSIQQSPAVEDSRMKTPVYFLSIGGPSMMYEVEHPAYKELSKIGWEITSKVKPRAVVVFSAHWQAGVDTVQVNTAENTDLIYDFYGFPSHYYEEKYPNVGSKELATKVLDAFKQAGIKAEGVKRGLDHGVWAGFKCAFEPESNPLNVPIVQVSLFNTEDPMQHYRLGEAVQQLRDENILIIVAGMAVHNLGDFRFTRRNPQPLPYTVSFDEALKDAVTTPPAERARALADLLKRRDARQAHPTLDHLLPIHVGAGAAGEDLGKRLWTLKEGSMSWAQYRFGEIDNSSSAL